MTWEHYLQYWSFGRGSSWIPFSNAPVMRNFMLSFLLVWIKCWTSHRAVGELGRHEVHVTPNFCCHFHISIYILVRANLFEIHFWFYSKCLHWFSEHVYIYWYFNYNFSFVLHACTNLTSGSIFQYIHIHWHNLNQHFSLCSPFPDSLNVLIHAYIITLF